MGGGKPNANIDWSSRVLQQMGGVLKGNHWRMLDFSAYFLDENEKLVVSGSFLSYLLSVGTRGTPSNLFRC